MVQVRQPHGGECYKCYDTRRRYWQDWSAQRLIQERERNPEVEQQWVDRRRDRCQDGSTNKREGLTNIKSKTLSDVAHVDEEYEEGARQDLLGFAAEMSLNVKVNVKDTEALIEYVGNHYPHMDVSLRNGTWVVETPDGSAGQGKRRFRRAVQKSNIRQYEEEHEDRRCAHAEYDWRFGC